jgi:anti-anti-sigma factor
MSEDLASVQFRYVDGIVIVALGGEFDIATADVLAGALQTACEGDFRHVTIDLGDVRFFGLSALDQVLGAWRTLADSGRTVNLIRLSPGVERLMSIFDLGFLAAPVSVTVPDQDAAATADAGLEIVTE